MKTKIIFYFLLLIPLVAHAATRNVVPRADSEGGVGTAAKSWSTGFIDTVTTVDTSSTGTISGVVMDTQYLEYATGGALIVRDDFTVNSALNAVGLYSKGFAIENLAAADDDFEFWIADVPMTIIKVGIHCRGTCTTPAQISLEDRAGNAMTHNVPTASTGADNTVYVDVTAGNSLVAGEGMRFDVDNALDPETDVYTINFVYTTD